ncbi:hypothetical protein CR513_28618, partial [Mucuna pruriens]
VEALSRSREKVTSSKVDIDSSKSESSSINESKTSYETHRKRLGPGKQKSMHYAHDLSAQKGLALEDVYGLSSNKSIGTPFLVLTNCMLHVSFQKLTCNVNTTNSICGKAMNGRHPLRPSFVFMSCWSCLLGWQMPQAHSLDSWIIFKEVLLDDVWVSPLMTYWCVPNIWMITWSTSNNPQEKYFHTLEEKLTNALVLALPNIHKSFELEYDASNVGVEKLNALVRALWVSQYYLLTNKFIV